MFEVCRWRASAVRLAFALTFGLALLVLPGTAAAQDSCAGSCGTVAPSGTCYCDAACVNYGDCCGDYQYYCANSGPTCQTMCNSGSDCGYACPVGDGSTSWCGHYNCYTPEQESIGPCAEACDYTSYCGASCTQADGSSATCGAYKCTDSPRYQSNMSVMEPADPCTESGSGLSWSVTCQKDSSKLKLGGSALGMEGWGYYTSRLAIDTATAQAGVKARFFIAGTEIGSATSPALDAYALVRPISTNCKDGQTGVYLRSAGSVVWKKTLDKTCMTVPTKLTELPGQTCAEVTLYNVSSGDQVIYDQQIPYAKVGFRYSVHGIGASISAEARAKLLYNASFRLSTMSATGKLTPEAVGSISGSGGVSISAFGAGAEIGVRAQTAIVDYVLPNTLELTTPPGSNQLALHYKMDYQRKPNTWELRAYLKVFFWWASKTWTHKIGGGTWGGDSAPTNIIERWWNTGFDGLNPLMCSQHVQNYNNTWPSCGDGTCNGSETACTCSTDCGPCNAGPVCGDGICDYGETCKTDCGYYPTCIYYCP